MDRHNTNSSGGWVARALATDAEGPGFKTAGTQDFSKTFSSFIQQGMQLVLYDIFIVMVKPPG